MQILDVTIFGRRYCLELASVERILLLMDVDPIPQGPRYLLGFFNYDGESVPVVDVAVRLGMERKGEYSLDMSVVLCNAGHGSVGLLVDGVQSIREVSDDDVQLNNMFSDSHVALRGVIDSGGFSSLFLNSDVLTDVEFGELALPEQHLLAIEARVDDTAANLLSES